MATTEFVVDDSGSNYKPTPPPAAPKALGAKANARKADAMLEAAQQTPAE